MKYELLFINTDVGSKHVFFACLLVFIYEWQSFGLLQRKR